MIFSNLWSQSNEPLSPFSSYLYMPFPALIDKAMSLKIRISSAWAAALLYFPSMSRVKDVALSRSLKTVVIATALTGGVACAIVKLWGSVFSGKKNPFNHPVFRSSRTSPSELPTFFLERPDLVTQLPSGLRVNGNLSLITCSALTSLPVGLKVGGNLLLEFCRQITSLPVDLDVSGDLHLVSCRTVTSLPVGFKVRRSLIFGDCPALTSLPVDLKVHRDLSLCACPALTSLPLGLDVGRDLFLFGCPGLTSLPSDWKIGRHLTINFQGLCNVNMKLMKIMFHSSSYHHRVTIQSSRVHRLLSVIFGAS